MSLLHPFMSVAQTLATLGKSYIEKLAGDATTSFSAGGRLYLSQTGEIRLSVPAAFIDGIFDTLMEAGLERPKDAMPRYAPGILIMTKEEVGKLGAAAISERGHIFRYNIDRIKTIIPDGDDNIAKAWIVPVHSPELSAFRRSYGLSSVPDAYLLHIVAAIRRKNVLRTNTTSKVNNA